MNRRHFLHSASFAATAGWLSAGQPEQPETADREHLERIGINLFTIPRLLEDDASAALAKLAEIGYKEIEIFGPYPFSVPEAHERWNSITPSLSFSMSGYFGKTGQEFKQLLDANGLAVPAMQTDLKTLDERLDEVAEAASLLGFRYAGIAAMPEELRPDLDGYKRAADLFNELGRRLNPYGVTFMYHNHGYGLVELEGEIPFNVVIERTEPDYVALEMDVFWMTAGRADPIAYLESYPGRFKLMHIKDMTEKVHFAGDGGTPQQWIELFPHMTDAGKGFMDLPVILAAARTAGVDHFFLERDQAPDPDATLRDSFNYLAAIEFEPVG